ARPNGPISTIGMPSIVTRRGFQVVERQSRAGRSVPRTRPLDDGEDRGVVSGVNFDVSARSRHTHQNIAFGFLARCQAVVGIHVYIAFEQFGHTSPATPLAAAA